MADSVAKDNVMTDESMTGETKVECEKVIFFGNGPLAEAVLEVLEGVDSKKGEKEADNKIDGISKSGVEGERTGKSERTGKDEKTKESEIEVIFRARTKEDLEEVKRLKRENPAAHGVLASYGVMIREDVLDLFEPEGILNIHPSLLPRYRGASPIESAILAGDTEFGVSVMKLVKAMDAGPIYWQGVVPGLPLMKSEIYGGLAEAGAKWLVANLENLPEPKPQDDTKATFTEKMTKEMGVIDPSTETATEILRKIIAFQGFPKVKYAFFGQNCIILAAHIAEQDDRAVLTIPCADGRILAIDRLQPEGRRPMDAKSFVNGYGRK